MRWRGEDYDSDLIWLGIRGLQAICGRNSRIKGKIKITVKGSGQECPLHTSITTYCAVPPITVPLSVSTSNSSVPPFTKTVLKWSADDPLGVICSVPVQSDASV